MATERLRLLWLQSGGCGGCTLSTLGAQTPDFFATLEAGGIDLVWHPAIGAETGSEALGLLRGIADGAQPLDIFCLEGAVVRGPGGSGAFHMLSGTGEPMLRWIERLAGRARHVLAIGSCAAFGGVTAAGDNVAEACGLQYEGAEPGGLLGAEFRAGSGLPVINVAGCPTHPNWVTETLLQVAAGELAAADLDELARPRAYTDSLVHHGCPRNEFYEYKASAGRLSEMGCLMEHLGCIGTQARADCNIRPWNGEGSCLRGGFPCINCTAPGFEEPGHTFAMTPKLAGIPVGLPTDMPKAWFVALASLSKAATPLRLKENAVADRVRVAPGGRRRGS